jgi:hypothetical protein
MSHSFSERRTVSKMSKRLICIWLAGVALFMSGCGLGPSMMRANHLTYNDAVESTERQELLLNIVRLRYNEGPEFLTTSSISTQFTIDLAATAGALVGHDQEERTNLLNIGGAVGYSEKPTITFTPHNEKEFTQQLISPIDLETIFLLINYGWGIDRVLRLTSEGINGLRNGSTREEPTGNYDLQLREFAQIAKDLRSLQQRGLIEISFAEKEANLSGPISADKVNLSDILNANKDDYKLKYNEITKSYKLKKTERNLILRFSKTSFEYPESEEIVNRLRLAPNVRAFRMVNAPGSQIKAAEIVQDSADLILSTRSVLGTMAYLSQGVSVPKEHLDIGVVTSNPISESSRKVISDLFQVKVQKEKPDDASLSVPYRGYWFYIEENDISSKRTLGVLNSLVRLKIRAAGAQNIPVLTLPVGQ